MAQNQSTRNWTFTGLLDRIRGLKILLVLLLFIGLGVTCLFLGAQRPSGVARDVLIAIGTTCISTSMVAYCFDLLVRGESQRTLRDTIASAVTDPADFFEALSPGVRERMIEAILGRGHLDTVSPRCSDRVAVEALSRQLGENRKIAEPLLQLVKAHYSGARRYDSRYFNKVVISAGDSAADACTVICEISYKEAVRFLRKDPTKPLVVRIAAVKDEQAYKRIAAGNEWALVYLEREDFRVEVTACRIGGVEALSNATGIDHPPGLHVLEFSVPSNGRSADPEAPVDIALTVRQTHRVRLPVLIYDLTETFQGCEFSVTNEHPEIEKVRVLPRMTSTDTAPEVRKHGSRTQTVSSDAWVFPTTSVVIALHWKSPQAPPPAGGYPALQAEQRSVPPGN